MSPVTHGLTPQGNHHPLYSTWSNMMARCTKPYRRDYIDYGGRGIKVCERWQDVRLFVEDIEGTIGPRPRVMTLDRIDNDGHYEPGNVRWVTSVIQNNNRRTRSCHAIGVPLSMTRKNVRQREYRRSRANQPV